MGREIRTRAVSPIGDYPTMADSNEDFKIKRNQYKSIEPKSKAGAQKIEAK